MDIFTWIEQELQPQTCASTDFIYEDMDSQSGHTLPIIYRPFDAGKRSHWRDRGSAFDFLFSTGGGRLLDFGPGDGWPSLIVAPFVDEVVGVDGALRRVEVCAENAQRLGLKNTRFVHVAPGETLPFEDASFDGVMAASSVEQTPDPKATLRELYRVLRPGGRLRISYEALDRYRGGQERDLWLWKIDNRTCRLILYDRQIDRGRARQYSLTFAISRQELVQALSGGAQTLTFSALTLPRLRAVRDKIIDVLACTLTHPSGATFAAWLDEIGFREVKPTHGGAWFAGELFDTFAAEARPQNLAGVDAMLRPLVRVVVQMAAPLNVDPMLTAVK